MSDDAGAANADLEGRYEGVCARVAGAAERSGRTADDVFVVAVTKYAEPEDIRRLLELGHVDFGENRVQQLIQRASQVQEWQERLRVLPETAAKANAAERVLAGAAGSAGQAPSGAGTSGAGASAAAGSGEGSGPISADQRVRWHMIGPLQRNKARRAVEIVRLIHSVDNLRLAEELQQVLHRTEQRVEVLLQINASGEESKAGVPIPAAIPMAEQIDHIYNLTLRGLMTMAPYSENPEDARPVFSRCRELFEEMTKLGLGDGRFNLLSMGMSGDFEVGIEEGANIVRVGTAIFGERREIPDED